MKLLRTCTCMGELQIRSCSGPLRLRSWLNVWASVEDPVKQWISLVCPFSSAKLSPLTRGSQMSCYNLYIPPTYDPLKIFFSFPSILISEFGVIQSWSQSLERTSLTHKYPHRERESINLAARAREEGISCSTNARNVAALCYSVFVIQFVPQERLTYNCICMITRLCMQSQTNPFESYRLIKQHPRTCLYCINVQFPMCFFDAGQKKSYHREEQHHDK